MQKKKKITRFLFIMMWLIILPIGMITKTFQNDTFYSIKIGEWICHHGIDMMDHFSFHINLAYSYPHWLYDCFMYLIYHWGGYTGIYISTIVLFIILVVTIYITNTEIAENKMAIFLGVIMSALVLSVFATARAQLVSYILFVLELLFIEAYLKKGKKRFLLGLLIISLALCNIHVATWPFYFIVYLPFIAEYILAIILGKLKTENKFISFIKRKFEIEKNDRVKVLIVVMLLSLLTGLLTPIGNTPYTYLIKTMMGSTQKYISEHQMITLKDSPFTIVMTILTLFLAFFNKSKIRDFFMICGLIFMSIISVRHMALLGVLGTICFVRTYDLFLTTFNQAAEQGFQKFMSSKLGLILSFVFVTGFTAFFLNIHLQQEFVPENFYPVKAVEYIKENIDVSSMRLLNGYNYGSYLLFNDIPVFIDSRADLYTKPFSGFEYDIFEDDCNLRMGSYRDYVEFYNITHIMVRQDEYMYDLLKKDPDYKELYKDKMFVLYKRIITEKIKTK